MKQEETELEAQTRREREWQAAWNQRWRASLDKIEKEKLAGTYLDQGSHETSIRVEAWITRKLIDLRLLFITDRIIPSLRGPLHTWILVHAR